MEHKRSGAGSSGSDSELNKRTPEGSRLSGGFLCCTNFTRPTGNLDSRSGAEVMKMLCTLRQKMNKTLVVITHDARIAAIAPRRFRIVDGHLTEVKEQ